MCECYVVTLHVIFSLETISVFVKCVSSLYELLDELIQSHSPLVAIRCHLPLAVSQIFCL